MGVLNKFDQIVQKFADTHQYLSEEAIKNEIDAKYKNLSILNGISELFRNLCNLFRLVFEKILSHTKSETKQAIKSSQPSNNSTELEEAQTGLLTALVVLLEVVYRVFVAFSLWLKIGDKENSLKSIYETLFKDNIEVTFLKENIIESEKLTWTLKKIFTTNTKELKDIFPQSQYKTTTSAADSMYL